MSREKKQGDVGIVKIIYIAGSGRSGSTLMSLLLSQFFTVSHYRITLNTVDVAVWGCQISQCLPATNITPVDVTSHNSCWISARLCHVKYSASMNDLPC